MKVSRGEHDTRQAIAEVLSIFRRDPPAAFLAFPRETRAVDRAFEIPYEQDRDVFGTLWQIRAAPSPAGTSQ